MPSSHYFQLNEIVDLIALTNPVKVLDIGVGFGKYGFLAREYLELWKDGGEYQKWDRQIDGIEAFEPYITPVHKFIYNTIFIGNALDILPSLQEAVYGNPFETHKYGWKREDFNHISDKFFLRNMRSTICFIGDDSSKIKKILKERRIRTSIVSLLDFLRLKKPIKKLIYPSPKI